ncbi:SGNH/GDSL hydrolase family protein [Deinococcus sp.]|uniref:SGNH/GDSL hydrolase family protein n=1 Tax=Deinococcus sp. TaxID=47478 RepID=UPI0025E5B6A8|nr:SGNH/GDSL hydrolase family protein [Deinococcus sp.]
MHPFSTGQKLIFIGDSITDAGRTDGVGEYGGEHYGDGYVARVRELLLARAPQTPLHILNRGVGGDTVRHLAARWQRDVLDQRPDWLSVKIGVNDVWRSFNGPSRDAVSPPEYTRTLRTLLGQAAAQGTRLVLVTPFLIEANRAEAMRVAVEERAASVAELAREFSAPLVALQPAFDAACQADEPLLWSPDRVHPSGPGHMLIALEWLRALGL